MSKISKPGKSLGLTPAGKIARSPKCARCRNHGFIVQLKGHAGMCPFSLCNCWKCALITERTKIMAIQRRIGKNKKEEPLTSVCHREAQQQAGGKVSYIDIMSDSTSKTDKDSMAYHVSISGHVPSSNVRMESVIKMPTGKTEGDGKMYAALVPVKSLNEATAKSSDFREQVPQPMVSAGTPAGVETKEGVRYGHPPWNAMQGTLHFPPDDIIAAVAQRDLYPSELMMLPFPFNPFASTFQINQAGLADYGCQAILVNMPPPPLGPGPRPGTLGDPPLGFPRLHPSTVPCVSEPGPTQDCRAPFPPPPPPRSLGLEEELLLRHPFHLGLHKDRE